MHACANTMEHWETVCSMGIATLFIYACMGKANEMQRETWLFVWPVTVYAKETNFYETVNSVLCEVFPSWQQKTQLIKKTQAYA